MSEAMTDRELLEKAAKAAGYVSFVWTGWPGAEFFRVQDADKDWQDWEPLTDDGDALRLAVKLRMFLDFYEEESQVQCIAKTEVVYEQFNCDAHAATRRAITRAAAEIGKAMQ